MAQRAAKENVAALHKMAETWLQLAEELLPHERPIISGSDQNAPTPDKVQ